MQLSEEVITAIKTALEFYAKREHYSNGPIYTGGNDVPGEIYVNSIEADGGEIARGVIERLHKLSV